MQKIPIFQLDDIIEEYNKTSKTQYNLNETFGFEFFNRKLLKKIKSTIDYIHHGIDQDFFTLEEKAYLKQRETQLKEVIGYCQQQNKEKPCLIRDEVLEHSIKVKEHYLRWLDYQKQQFIDEKNWQSWFAETTVAKEIRAVWEKHSHFSAHTHAALLEASILIESLIEHHRQAAIELKNLKNRLRIPQAIYNAYQNYLSLFYQEASNIQQQLAEAMLARLKMYDQQQSNVMNVVYTELQKQGARIKHHYLPLPEYTDTLQSKQINGFHQFIIQHGNKNIQKQLQQLSWFKTSAKLPAVTRRVFNHLQLIPENLAAAVPEKLRKPQWLFKGENLRLNYFKDKIALLVLFKQSPEVKTIRLSLKINDCQMLLTEIHRQEEAIKYELLELNNQYQSLSSLFQRKTKQFLRQWQKILLQHREQQLENKLILAEKLSQALNERYLNSLDAAVYAWQQSQFLSQLLLEIQNDSEKYMIDPRFNLRLERLKKGEHHLLNLNRIFNVFQTLAKGEMVTQSEFYYFSGYMDLLQLRDKSHYEALLELCLLQRMEIAKQFSHGLKTFFISSGPNQQVVQLLCLNLVIQKWGIDTDKEKIEQILKKFFLRFLETVLKNILMNKNTVNSEHLVLAKDLVNKIGQQVTYAGKTLPQHLSELEAIQHNPYSLKCKCLSLASSLADEFLQSQYEKDINLFDKNIEQAILSDHKLNYQLSHMQILTQIRDRAVEENKPLEALSLKKSEQLLIGLIGEDTQHVKSFMNASIQAHTISQRVNNKEIPLKQRTSELKTLTLKLQSILVEKPQFLYSRANNRLLFSKTYIHTNLLPDEPDITHKISKASTL